MEIPCPKKVLMIQLGLLLNTKRKERRVQQNQHLKSRVRGQKRKQVISSSSSEDEDYRNFIDITEATARRLTRNMIQKKPRATTTDELEIFTIEIEEDILPWLPDSPQPASLQQHQKELGEAFIDTYLARFDNQKQSPFSEDMYQIPYNSPAMERENPPLCFQAEENQERDEMYRQHKKRNKKLKRQIKEYKVLNRVIKQENDNFRAQSVNL